MTPADYARARRTLLRGDAVLAALIKRHGPCGLAAAQRTDHFSALVRAIISLGESMSLKTVAEGIEDAQQAEKLRSLGCDLGQGFFYGKPMSAVDLGGHAERLRPNAKVSVSVA